jgi:spermidine/putrescine transport system substrate-binding protein
MTDRQPRIDPTWLRGALSPRFSRRDFLRRAGVGAGALGLSSILAACGVSGEGGGGTTAGPTAGAEGSPEWWADLVEAGPGDVVNFTNWPAYIDTSRDDEGNRTRPTLDAFTESTGIEVVYRADINDNAGFYAAIRPALEAGQDTGHDIIVITNGDQLTEMIALGYLTELDHSLTPNFEANVGPAHADPAYDEGNRFTMAWQSGFTGIAWNTEYVDAAPSSFMDLFNEAYSGHIGLFSNLDDAPAYAMLALGIDPETSTPEQWQQAADFLIEQRDRGILRGFFDQAYLTALENGDLWITMAWSGDVINDKLYFPDEFGTFEFATPSEGAVIWTDNMCIPKRAANPLGAIQLMDWYYQPDMAAKLTEFNAYVTPVPAGGDIVQADAEAATGEEADVLGQIASSPYVFPPPDLETFSYRVRTGDEIQQWNDIFQPVFIS